MLQHPPLIFLCLLPSVFSSSLVAKPGCLDQCGNLLIPFPFGVGSDCSLGPSFNIGCNTSTNPPKAYLNITNFTTELIEINTSQIRVKFWNLASACYDDQRGPKGLRTTNFWALSGTQYTYSDGNWLTGIGCDDFVSVVGGSAKQNFGRGCVSYCENGSVLSCPDDDTGQEFGSGCCHTPIPEGTIDLVVNLTDVHENWRESKLFGRSYAFVGEMVNWNQSTLSYLLSSSQDNTTAFINTIYSARRTPPVVRLDWRITGAKNCSQAKQNLSSYACKDNSVCVDFDANAGGYLCNCSEGYEGNPYLPGGCRDIDECADSRTSPCASNSGCTNIPGSVACLCRKGYYGDGRSEGSGCTRLPLSRTISNFLIGLGCGLGVLLLLSMCFWLHKILQKRRNRKRKEELFKHILLQHQINEGTLGYTKLFPAKELEKATDHFNASRVLGQGGQGIVYKGMLSNGMIVAIKKLKMVDEDQFEQFINEVVILSQINHRNVVKLLGCCLGTEAPLLVYEFVPNGNLFNLIHGPSIEFPVTWNMRLKIAADIAGALAYLHSASSTPIYHRDIKSSNILLDEKYVVKVSDFGISRSVAVDQTHLTTSVKGTFGYLDPEYFQSSQFTEKSDVYSFGVVLVELLTGERPISLNGTDEERGLAARFMESMEANNLGRILDAQVYEQGRKAEVIAVARLAQRCLNLKGKMRPTMKEVVTELESFRMSQMSSTIKHKFEEASMYKEPTMISDTEYTWTPTDNSVVALSSSDRQPLTFATM